MRQQGSALIIAMVFLIVLTLLGMSTMTTSRTELRMANNAQFASLAFQAAESGIALMLGTNSLKTQLSTDLNQPFEQTYQLASQGIPGSLQADASAGFLAEGLAAGYSVNTPALHFRITSTGTSAGGGEAQHIQGFFIIGASAN